jgi:hypothetical protein
MLTAGESSYWTIVLVVLLCISPLLFANAVPPGREPSLAGTLGGLLLTTFLTLVLWVVYLSSAGTVVVALRKAIVSIVRSTFDVDLSAVLSSQAASALGTNPMDFSLAMLIVGIGMTIGLLQLYWLCIQLGIKIMSTGVFPYVSFVGVVSATPGITTPAVLFVLFETVRLVYLGAIGHNRSLQLVAVVVALATQLGLWVSSATIDEVGTLGSTFFMLTVMYWCLRFAADARAFFLLHAAMAVVYLASIPPYTLPVFTLLFVCLVACCAWKLKVEQDHLWTSGTDAAPDIVIGTGGSLARVHSSADLSSAAPPRILRLAPWRPWAPFILRDGDTGRVVVPRHVTLVLCALPFALAMSSCEIYVRCIFIALLLVAALLVPLARNFTVQRSWWRYYAVRCRWWCVLTAVAARARVEWLWLHNQFLVRAAIWGLLPFLLIFRLVYVSGNSQTAFAVVVLAGALMWTRIRAALAARRAALDTERLRFG